MARVTEADVELMRNFEALSRLDLIKLLVEAREARDLTARQKWYAGMTHEELQRRVYDAEAATELMRMALSKALSNVEALEETNDEQRVKMRDLNECSVIGCNDALVAFCPEHWVEHS